MSDEKSLIRKVKNLKKNTELKQLIDSKIENFEKIGKSTSKKIFSEACFCIMTANFQAEKSIMIQDNIGNGFLSDSEKILASKLKKLGHRFPNTRANYIVNSRGLVTDLGKNCRCFESEQDVRKWVVDNIKGLGFKESSHFLRNIGFKDLAIIDFHIIDLMVEYSLIERPKTITKKRYLEIEDVLRGLGKKLKMNLAELDFYLWYLETGKVLK